MTTMLGIMLVIMLVAALGSGHMTMTSEDQNANDAQQVSSLNHGGEK